MYDKGITTLGAAAGAGALPFTGLNVIWLLLAAFALVAAGLAILRVVPKTEA